MGENLVIVESPAKAKTIGKFLGEGFTVKSSFGHIRDLASNTLSVDLENGYEPNYVISDDKKRVVSELKAIAKGALVGKYAIFAGSFFIIFIIVSILSSIARWATLPSLVLFPSASSLDLV